MTAVATLAPPSFGRADAFESARNECCLDLALRRLRSLCDAGRAGHAVQVGAGGVEVWKRGLWRQNPALWIMRLCVTLVPPLYKCLSISEPLLSIPPPATLVAT